MARATAEEKPKNETTYVVLHGNKGSTGIQIVGDVIANGPEQAVRRAAEDQEGIFIAIPARNWTIVEQESETPPPVISQKVSKWADEPTITDPDEKTETVEVDEADVAELSSVVDVNARDASATTKIPAPHPADTIGEDGGA